MAFQSAFLLAFVIKRVVISLKRLLALPTGANAPRKQFATMADSLSLSNL